MLAYDYPILNIFWSMFIFFGFFLWIWVLVMVFSDLFRSRDLSGWGKAAWFVGILFLPLFGALLYLIVRGGKMHEHAAQAAQEQQAEFDEYVKNVAGESTTAQLAKLADLRDRGAISEEEFTQQKTKLLAS